jgi:hypothetical protein
VLGPSDELDMEEPMSLIGSLLSLDALIVTAKNETKNGTTRSTAQHKIEMRLTRDAMPSFIGVIPATIIIII